MVSDDWLEPSLVVLDATAFDLAELIAGVSGLLATATGLDRKRVEAALREGLRKADFGVGRGVAVPHAELVGIEQPVVALVRNSRPIHVQALDMQPADLFFVVLACPDDRDAHLVMLAHLARLAQSRPLVEGLRKARDVEEALALVKAAELQHAVISRVVDADTAEASCLAVITLQGEQAVDGVVVQLLEDGYGDASVLDAQSAREAVTHELPLFTGFQDLFGDPDGRRVILVEVKASRADELIQMVRQVCEECQADHAGAVILPIRTRWSWRRPRRPPPPTAGH